MNKRQIINRREERRTRKRKQPDDVTYKNVQVFGLGLPLADFAAGVRVGGTASVNSCNKSEAEVYIHEIKKYIRQNKIQ